MQTEFDMNRRFWLGGRWAPTLGQNGRREPDRAAIEIGSRIDVPSADGRRRGRVRLLEGDVTMRPLEATGTLVRYDESRASTTPILRLTTFWPGPARHDLYLDLGFWGEAMGVEYRPRGSEDETLLRFAALGLSWDLWHGTDLEDYLRLRIGGALDDHLQAGADRRIAATPVARIETDVVVDRAGHHRITADVGAEAPIVLADDGATVQRKLASNLGYELVVLAINDQPVTLRLSGTGGWRDDLIPAARGWEVGGGVGMRVSFWAPPPARPATIQPTTASR